MTQGRKKLKGWGRYSPFCFLNACWMCAKTFMSNSALVYEPKCGGRGEVAGPGSQPMSTSVHRSPNKLWKPNSIFNLWSGTSTAAGALASAEALATAEIRRQQQRKLQQQQGQQPHKRELVNRGTATTAGPPKNGGNRMLTTVEMPKPAGELATAAGRPDWPFHCLIAALIGSDWLFLYMVAAMLDLIGRTTAWYLFR